MLYEYKMEAVCCCWLRRSWNRICYPCLLFSFLLQRFFTLSRIVCALFSCSVVVWVHVVGVVVFLSFISCVLCAFAVCRNIFTVCSNIPHHWAGWKWCSVALMVCTHIRKYVQIEKEREQASAVKKIERTRACEHTKEISCRRCPCVWAADKITKVCLSLWCACVWVSFVSCRRRRCCCFFFALLIRCLFVLLLMVATPYKCALRKVRCILRSLYTSYWRCGSPYNSAFSAIAISCDRLPTKVWLFCFLYTILITLNTKCNTKYLTVFVSIHEIFRTYLDQNTFQCTFIRFQWFADHAHWQMFHRKPSGYLHL